jgi:hypothetical protein
MADINQVLIQRPNSAVRCSNHDVRQNRLPISAAPSTVGAPGARVEVGVAALSMRRRGRIVPVLDIGVLLFLETELVDYPEVSGDWRQTRSGHCAFAEREDRQQAAAEARMPVDVEPHPLFG